LQRKGNKRRKFPETSLQTLWTALFIGEDKEINKKKIKE